MRSIISLITAAALLLHFGLGCCAHHAHSAEGNDCASHVHIAVGCSHHEHDHEEQPEGQRSPDDPAAPEDSCNEGQCVFLVGAKVTPAKEVSPPWMPALVPELTTQIDALTFASSPSRAEERPVLPIRLHLLHQLFLN